MNIRTQLKILIWKQRQVLKAKGKFINVFVCQLVLNFSLAFNLLLSFYYMGFHIRILSLGSYIHYKILFLLKKLTVDHIYSLFGPKILLSSLYFARSSNSLIQFPVFQSLFCSMDPVHCEIIPRQIHRRIQRRRPFDLF